ncbi:MAG: ATP-grasp domain-containing protein, partial [Melioribacteraceae bacterium]|nr:ATP-grasp domain-containing protein [Melioribacteraceae bacterium]
MKIVIVYNLPIEESRTDDLDVLVQVNAVEKSLLNLGHEVILLGVTLDLKKFSHQILQLKPDLVFNLVESINGIELYLHFVPVILEKLQIPFTGPSAESLYTTTNKVLTKRLLDLYSIPTPKWFTSETILNIKNLEFPYIIKPIYEDASVGLDDASIVSDNEKLYEELSKRTEKYGECFFEQFIDGREFNISILNTREGVKVLPIAEIRFEDYPEEKVKIVSYDAKWNENSFEYSHTVRGFEFPKSDNTLLADLEKATLNCWNKFNLKGFVRVDFRVDNYNNIYVLEINGNPGIAPDSGFYAASQKYGWDYDKMIEEIINSVK